MKLEFKSIPKFCISLKRSQVRRDHVTKEFEKFDIHNVSFYDAIDKNNLIVPELSAKRKIEGDAGNMPGILACMMSHVELIKRARTMKMKMICIFEDDVIFCDDFKDRIAYLETLDLEFDMLLLGGHFGNPDRKMIPNHEDAEATDMEHIYKVKHMGGTYCYIITDKVYDFIIRNATYNFGMDQMYSDHVYSSFNCYAFVPFLAACTHVESEITGSMWKYGNIDWFYQQERIQGLMPETLTTQIVQVKREQPKKIVTKQTNLLDCTFITAVKLESKDREFNFLRVIQFLCDNFATNIIIKESAEFSRVVELLPYIDRKECNIIHTFEHNIGAFHRTRLLNEALVASKTSVTVNYDIDVFMEPKAYVAARDKVMSGWDLVFPFLQGDNAQKQVTVPEHIKNDYKGESLFNTDWITPWQSYCGHCQFFRTDSYIAGGMENENFMSYGPEDREREERFRKLGYKITWMNDPIYHIEHSRDHNSSPSNPHFHANEDLMHRLRNMSKLELQEYYKNQEYLKKYI